MHRLDTLLNHKIFDVAETASHVLFKRTATIWHIFKRINGHVIYLQLLSLNSLEPLAKLWVDERQSDFESIFGME